MPLAAKLLRRLEEDDTAKKEAIRTLFRHSEQPQAAFRQALMGLPRERRDAWFDALLELDPILEDGPALPRGCVPYLPCSVDAVLRMVDNAQVASSDVFVDIGSGTGRSALLAHLLTGADSIGIEIQPQLAHAHRKTIERLGVARCSVITGDVAELGQSLAFGSVFFLYCPFSGTRIDGLLQTLSLVAKARPIRIGCVDLTLPPCAWLRERQLFFSDLRIYESL